MRSRYAIGVGVRHAELSRRLATPPTLIAALTSKSMDSELGEASVQSSAEEDSSEEEEEEEESSSEEEDKPKVGMATAVA